jgi:hypothetical protein
MSKVRGEHTDVPANLMNDSFAADECAICETKHPHVWSSHRRLPCAQAPLLKLPTVSMQSQISTITSNHAYCVPKRIAQPEMQAFSGGGAPHLQSGSNMHHGPTRLRPSVVELHTRGAARSAIADASSALGQAEAPPESGAFLRVSRRCGVIRRAQVPDSSGTEGPCRGKADRFRGVDCSW